VNFANTTAYTTYRFRATAGLANPGLTLLNFMQNANLNSNSIINLANPTNAQDATTKNYVYLYVSALSVFNVGTRGILLNTNAISLIAPDWKKQHKLTIFWGRAPKSSFTRPRAWAAKFCLRSCL
jgi:hypothetical protein